MVNRKRKGSGTQKILTHMSIVWSVDTSEWQPVLT